MKGYKPKRKGESHSLGTISSWSRFKKQVCFFSIVFLFLQLGPQQLKYMTVLKDSSECLAFSPCCSVLESIAEDEEESFFACDKDLRWLFTLCWADLKAEFHLQRPWSFKVSTTPTLIATVHALLLELIIDFLQVNVVKVMWHTLNILHNLKLIIV